MAYIRCGGSVDHSIEDAILTGALAGEYKNDRITKIENYRFAVNPALTKVVFNNVTEIGSSVFSTCHALVEAILPKLTTLGTNTFANDDLLERVEMPEVTSIPERTFQYCYKLVTGIFRKATSIASYGFGSCSELELIDCAATVIQTNAFQNSAVKTLIIRSDSVCTLNGTNAFNNTPFKSGGTGGTLYVPNDLIASYQAATNWSTILGYANNDIQAIEGSPYELS